MRKSSFTITLAMPLILAGLGGCMGNQQTLRAEFGEAVRANTAMQTVNPAAGDVPVPLATRDGQRTEQIIQDYRKDTGKAESGRIVTGVSR